MGIYIKGMEMPKVPGRMEAVIMIRNDGTAQIAVSPAEDQIGYWKEYSLASIPAHGKLIEAEPIMKFIVDGLNNKEFGYDQIKVLTEIQYAPTIIPAEEK